VHVRVGDIPAREYQRQLTADKPHSRLVRAISVGLDDPLDPKVVAAARCWFLSRSAAHRSACMVSAPVAATATTHKPGCWPSLVAPGLRATNLSSLHGCR
jgi:hypothetical protein